MNGAERQGPVHRSVSRCNESAVVAGWGWEPRERRIGIQERVVSREQRIGARERMIRPRRVASRRAAPRRAALCRIEMAQCSTESSLRETGADARFSSEGRRGDDKGWMAMSNVDERRGRRDASEQREDERC